MDLTNLTMGQAALVSLAGFLTVFIILLLISLIIRLNSWVIQKLQNGGKKSGKVEATASAGAGASAPAGVPSEHELTEEELAAITAALASVMGSSPDKLVIRHLQPAGQVYTPTWGNSARSEQMEDLAWQ